MFFGYLNTPKNEFSHAKYHSKFSPTTHPIPTPQWPLPRFVGATIFYRPKLAKLSRILPRTYGPKYGKYQIKYLMSCSFKFVD